MRRFSLPLLLFCFLLNVAVLRAQVNRRAAMDHLNRGTRELEAGDLDEDNGPEQELEEDEQPSGKAPNVTGRGRG